MPPQDWMTDTELLSVSDYVLNELNGLGIEISADTIAQQRLARPSHADLRALRKQAMP